MMSFDYEKLKERIKRKYDNFADFATAMGMKKNTFSLKINNIATFTSMEIDKACKLLDIKPHEIADYFFTLIVQKDEHKRKED